MSPVLSLVEAPRDPFDDPDVMVGEWRQRGVVFICGPSMRSGYVPDDACDCGFAGAWDYRMTYRWLESSGKRTDLVIRRDIARGWPHRPRDEGYWCMGGRDERCPACGDMERFDDDGNVIRTFVDDAGHHDLSVIRELAERV